MPVFYRDVTLLMQIIVYLVQPSAVISFSYALLELLVFSLVLYFVFFIGNPPK